MIDDKRRNFFSIVMPVYNVEKYLPMAIESVLNQTFDDFELILVDDCSPDDSLNICTRYAQQDSRVQLIHLKENAGVSNARNVGMELATGQYLMFMDSDDYIDSDIFEKVYKSLQKNPAEIVFFSITEEHFDARGKFLESVLYQLPEKYFSNQKSLRKYIIELEKKTLYGYACNKFYSLAYLRNLGLYYKEYALNEDILFNVAFCQDIKRMNVLNDPAYHYRKSMEMNSRSSKFVKDYFKLHEKRVRVILDQYKYWGMCDQKIRADLAAIYTRYIMSALQRNCDPKANMNFKSRVRWIKRLYDQTTFREIMPYGHPKNKLVYYFHFCLKKHMTLMSLFLGRIIYMVKTYCPKIFNMIQKNR